tara:strand:+ start:634 stop:894 length:261 start_codon:yes stop_codon:yes gene_type:complete
MTENSKLNLTITKIGDMYSVEMRDYHCNYCCVYEPSVKQAMKFAEIWFADANKREEANVIRGKAIKEMIELDKKAGIIKGNYDGLD